MLRFALALVLVLLGGSACDEETFEKPPDYDLAKPIRDLSALAQSNDDLSMPPDLARKDLSTIAVDLRGPEDMRLATPDSQ
jgi:hypothetical protein